jgi:anti-sigma regulatory factor (Ser/Thr protein kinase)
MLRLRLPAVVESLERVNRLVSGLAHEAQLTPAGLYKLRLATEELFVNIVKHGYGTSQPGGQVVIEGGVAEENVWIRLIDSGAPFDPFTAPDPTGLDLPLQDRVPGALGLYLARQAVDAASHEYVDGTNRTTLVLRRNRSNGEWTTGDAKDRADRQ